MSRPGINLQLTKLDENKNLEFYVIFFSDYILRFLFAFLFLISK